MPLTAITRWNPFAAPPPPPESTSLLGRMQDIATHELESSRALLSDFQDFIQQGNMLDTHPRLALLRHPELVRGGHRVTNYESLICLANYYWPLRCPASAIRCTSQTWETWKQARDAGAVTINYGLFAENIMDFLINAIFLFFAVKKVFEMVFKRNFLVKKQCPYCKEFVKGNATRCKDCGSNIDFSPSSRGR